MDDPADSPAARWRGALARFHVRWDALPGNVRGSIWMSISGLVFAVMVALIKHTGRTLPVIEILFIRQLFVLIYLSPAIARGFPAVFRTKRPELHAIRVGLSAVAMTAAFTALVHLPLAEATAISFSRALFTTVLAVFILRETVGWRRWSATAVGLIGVLVIVRPSPEHANEYALLGLLSAVFVAGIMIVLRLLSQTERPITIMAYQAVCLTVIMAVPAAWLWVTPTWEELLVLAVIGGVMSVGQYTNIKAFAAGEAAAVAPFEYGRLLFATVFGIWFFAEIPTIYTLIGAAIVIASTLYTMHRNAIKKQPAPAGPSDGH
ncbi:MAG: DMT family transporter [Alphaproteobacteria bacterium]|nr:DMT family transporter [Alphaproteobacteria bacterium]